MIMSIKQSIVIILCLISYCSVSRATFSFSQVQTTTEDIHSIDGLLPKEKNLFNKDSIDTEAFDKIDCHLRNIDFCYAGLIGSMQNIIPENDAELELRCDEIKASTSCIAIYNKRCQTFKVFAALSPLSDFDQLVELVNTSSSVEVGGLELPLPIVSSVLMNSDNNSEKDQSVLNNLKPVDLIKLCNPQAKKTKINRLLRDRLFELAKCANKRVDSLKPCLNDLKTAVQLFYEPRRLLPAKPTCCAMAKFRQCSKEKLDNICGLSSFEQLEQTFNSGSFSLKTLNRVCQQDSSKINSPYCLEVLPPPGLQVPQPRGSKASKLAKALDLISLSPQFASPM